MKIIDLTKAHEQLYFMCLEDWSDEIKEASSHKSCWYEQMKEKGLGVKLALNDDGEVGGMIQYSPAEYAPIEGDDLYFIHCIWVHGHKQGRGNFQKRGMGKALIQAAEEDVRGRGAKGLAAWGLALPFWMKASWFKKQGYKRVERQGISVLLWKSFAEDAIPPRWIRRQKKPQKVAGKVIVTGFINGWCSVGNMNFERAKKAAAEFSDRVEFRHINTADRNTLLEWGISDAVYIDDKEISAGPPLSYDKIKRRIARAVKRK